MDKRTLITDRIGALILDRLSVLEPVAPPVDSIDGFLAAHSEVIRAAFGRGCSAEQIVEVFESERVEMSAYRRRALLAYLRREFGEKRASKRRKSSGSRSRTPRPPDRAPAVADAVRTAVNVSPVNRNEHGGFDVDF